MADSETVRNLLDNKYFLFGLVVGAVLLGQVVKRVLSRFQNRKNRPPQGPESG